MLKIACNGFVEENGGSFPGSAFLILEELLKRGYEIDYFDWEGSDTLPGLSHYSNFRLVQLPNPAFYRKTLKKVVPRQLHRLFDRTVAALMQNLYSQRRDRNFLRNAIAREHGQRHYDLLLFMGLYGIFSLPGLPTLSWPQGTPHTEWLYIQSLRQQIIQRCGWLTYLQFMLFYRLKGPRVRADLKHSDRFICGSYWTRDHMVEYGMDPATIQVLPYPMNLEQFQPRPDRAKSDKKIFLWLGRIAARKRLDLLMPAFKSLLQERQDVKLKIIGGFQHIEGFKQLVDDFELPEFLDYQPEIDRTAIPDLLNNCDVLLQVSEGEDFGASIAEAICCGTPVLLGPDNGTGAFTTPGCAFKFEEYTPEAIKNAMLRALEALDKDRGEIVREARKTAEEYFNVLKTVDAIEVTLHSMVTQETNRTPSELATTPS